MVNILPAAPLGTTHRMSPDHAAVPIVFLRICEDRGLEPYGDLQGTLAGSPIYDWLMRLFERADSKYNSGLFHFHEEGERGAPDVLTPNLVVDDALLTTVINSLYYPSPFQFSVIPADILGQVYEQFLGRVIAVDLKHEAKVELKPEVAKAGGVYYTPTYIVDHIIERTIATELEGMTAAQLVTGGKRRTRLRVLDPACGSGSFLISAYQYLLDWFLLQYAADSDQWSKGRAARIRLAQDGSWMLTVNERKRILLDHIFGVDIDAQAVEVTKLSLLLKVLEGETEESVRAGAQLFQDRALPDLDGNIRCGNSLVGDDVFELPEMDEVDREGKDRINAFDWDVEFAEVMSEGGFGVVIGNPPYVYRNATEDALRPYYARHYATVQGNYDLYKFFLEKGLRLVRPGGRLGYIVSASFLVQTTFSRVRSLLLGSTIEHLAPMGPGVFARAAVDSCIVVLRKIAVADTHQIEIQAPVKSYMLGVTPTYAIRQQRFSQNADQVFNYRVTEQAAPLVERLLADFPPLETGFEFGVGVNTGYIRSELTGPHKVDARWHRMVPGTGISRYGVVQPDGWIMYDAEYVRSRGNLGRSLPDERFLSDPKILVVRTRNLSLARRIVATLDDTKAYNLNRLSNIIARDGYELRGLLGVLNSRLFDWLFSTQYYDYEIKPHYLRQCPMPDVNDRTLLRAVDEMFDAVARQRDARTQSDAARAAREVGAADKRIDRAVYDLFAIEGEQRDLIEGQMHMAFQVLGDDEGEDVDSDADTPDE